MRVSTIINNYNYGRFVGDAIESALAVEWSDKETIVVDDGSADDSRAVIEAFGDRIISIFTTNGGQARAANLGFERSTGDVVIFLDADDFLLPTLAKQVMAVWRPGVANVQYGMIYVDQKLRPLGRHWPVYTETHTPELVARLMRKTGAYQVSPTSGNAWGRNFLKEVFPLPTRDEGLQWIDMYLQKLAPFFGDVVSLRSPQCIYRRHGDNWSSLAPIYEYLKRYPGLARQVETVQRLGDDLLARKRRTASISRQNEYYAKVVLVSKRFFPRQHPSLLLALLVKHWQTVWHEEFNPRRKLVLIAWSLAVVATPRSFAGWLVVMRDNHDATMAKGLRRLLDRLIASG
jgi:glycosyltransferase involved in cell wall biosynthesis